MTRNPLQVERVIAVSIDRLWELTQDTSQHQRWDGRFTTIEPLPTTALNADAPARFRYAITVIPGLLRISGYGEHAGTRASASGSATSCLRFWSSHPLSLIERGSGYWRYVPVGDHAVRFITGYDYDVRWGRFGRCADRVWRPIMGRLTAWSFDRLRLWAERGIAPELTLLSTVTSIICALIIVPALAIGIPPLAVLAAVMIAALDGVTPKARRCKWTTSPRHPAPTAKEAAA
jgi:hypothetical protein